MGTNLEGGCLYLFGYPAPLSNPTDYNPGLADSFLGHQHITFPHER